MREGVSLQSVASNEFFTTRVTGPFAIDVVTGTDVSTEVLRSHERLATDIAWDSGGLRCLLWTLQIHRGFRLLRRDKIADADGGAVTTRAVTAGDATRIGKLSESFLHRAWADVDTHWCLFYCCDEDRHVEMASGRAENIVASWLGAKNF